MLETAAIIAIATEAVETVAIPAIGAWLASEAIGASRSKYNGIIQVLVGIARAVVKDLGEEAQPTPASLKKANAKASPAPAVRAKARARKPRQG